MSDIKFGDVIDGWSAGYDQGYVNGLRRAAEIARAVGTECDALPMSATAERIARDIETATKDADARYESPSVRGPHSQFRLRLAMVAFMRRVGPVDRLKAVERRFFIVPYGYNPRCYNRRNGQLRKVRP